MRVSSNRTWATLATLATLALPLCGCGIGGAQKADVRVVVPPLTAPLGETPTTGGVSGGVGGGTGGVGGATSPASGARAKRPNIVFILTDDLSWNLVPYMPHVLAMERAGESFGNYFVTDSLCCPSRASIFTGRFPHNTHVTSNSPPYGGFAVFHERGEELETFATALQKVGYRTGMMGKYLNGYRPNGGEGVPASFVPAGWNEWDVAGNGYPELGYTLNHDGTPVNYGSEPQDYLTEVLAEEGVAFIDHSAQLRQPFMLELATFAPHAPFVPAPRDENDFPGLSAPRSPAFDAANTNAPAWLSHFTPLEAQQIEQIDADFRRRAQAVQAVDRMIGELEATLTAHGLAQNTYLLFSSDNGLHMGEHRLMPGKQTAFDSDIRVPLIVVGPGVPAGRSVSALSENIDLCPTFERLGGAAAGANVDGRSLTPLLHDQPAPNWRREVLIEHHGPVLDAGDPDLPTRGAGNPSSYEALRTPASLFVEYVTGEREYYDLRTDPFELHNIAAHLSPAHLRRLHRALLAITGCHGQRQCWSAQHRVT